MPLLGAFLVEVQVAIALLGGASRAHKGAQTHALVDLQGISLLGGADACMALLAVLSIGPVVLPLIPLRLVGEWKKTVDGEGLGKGHPHLTPQSALLLPLALDLLIALPLHLGLVSLVQVGKPLLVASIMGGVGGEGIGLVGLALVGGGGRRGGGGAGGLRLRLGLGLFGFGVGAAFLGRALALIGSSIVLPASAYLTSLFIDHMGHK